MQGLRAVYEDEDVAVVYKPPGIHTKAGSNHKYAALEDALPAFYVQRGAIGSPFATFTPPPNASGTRRRWRTSAVRWPCGRSRGTRVPVVHVLAARARSTHSARAVRFSFTL